MENSKSFVKLSELVNDRFTVIRVWGYKWKMWDTNTNKMLTSDKYEQGYQKKWDVDTNRGKLDLSSGQIGTLLEAVLRNGVADLNGATFEVKSNGKTGMDIRYFFNVVRAPQPEPQQNTPQTRVEAPQSHEAPQDDQSIDLDSIPF